VSEREREREQKNHIYLKKSFDQKSIEGKIKKVSEIVTVRGGEIDNPPPKRMAYSEQAN
jgi:hypothetical protein